MNASDQADTRHGRPVMGGVMQAKVGDHIIVNGHHIGEPDRDAEIITVGLDDGPPFTVRWDDTGHETLFFPGNDAFVQHLGQPSADGR